MLSLCIISVLGLSVLGAHSPVVALLLVVLVYLVCWRKVEWGFYLMLVVMPLFVYLPSLLRRHH